MLLIKNIGCLATMDESSSYINNSCIIIDEQKILWCGPKHEMPVYKISQTIDAHGALVTPGFIDCHSHLIFAGSRAQEFAQRMEGKSYAEIMAQGGGIISTVKATHEAHDDELFKLALLRAQKILKQGVTTLEVKSGYGLSFKSELRILRLIKKLGASQSLELHPTYLGAHVIPAEYKNCPEEYVNLVSGPLLDKIVEENLALDCDVFCETHAFSVEQAYKILSAAHNLGLGLRAHVQQLGPSKGVSLLERLPIKSISHADFLSAADIALVARKKCVVEILPFAQLFLRAQQKTPVQELKASGVKLAIASDFNPGSAMCDDLLLAARLVITREGLDINSALKAITSTAAQALGRDRVGVIKKDYKADIVITRSLNIEEFFYDWSIDPIRIVLKNGQVVVGSEFCDKAKNF